MKNIIIFSILIITSLIIVTGCNLKSNDNNKEKNNMVEDNYSNEVFKTMKAMIDGKEYSFNLEDNETTKSFFNMLPLELNMNELNGNEKYAYLDSELPTNSYKPKRINIGDVMLYGENCIVVFYKSFDTSYSYTKIGHIEKLPDLDNKNITIKFEK